MYDIDVKIWRIATLTGAICLFLTLSFVGYQLFIVENTGVSQRLAESPSLTIFTIITYLVSVFAFVTVLIAFPCLLYRSIPFVIWQNWLTTAGRNHLNSRVKSLLGLLICAIIILILLFLKAIYFKA